MLLLQRFLSNKSGVYGVFISNGEILCHTYELPWLGNITNKSCIPSGDYSVVKSVSPRFGDVFYLKDVPRRTSILIHPGNSALDTRGCILPGLDVIPGGVIHSRDAIKRLYSILPDKFTLNVRGT